MKKLIFQIIFFLLSINRVSGTFNQYGTQDTVKERVNLFTDRNLYISGEKILFSAMVSGHDRNEIMSRILYCEIITPDGIKITGGKYLVINSISSGVLVIPHDLISGNYYIRSYTKFMRNEGPAAYSYILLKIVNPNRNEIQISSSGNLNSDSTNSYSSVITESILTDKSHYKARDTINISIRNTSQTSYQILNVAVVPELSSYNRRIKVQSGESQEIKSGYAPEHRGVSITGSVRDEINDDVLKGIRVNLSIIGEGRDFMAVKTDSEGRFAFSLPEYEGFRDLFLFSDMSGSLNPGIMVDNDFCPIPVQIITENFKLSPEERETVLKMAVNFQVQLSFDIDSADDAAINEVDYQAFYGKPDEVIRMDNYIQLPTLEEYLNELPTLVKVRKRSEGKYFKILGTQTELSEYDPLVMIDLVAIDDPAAILSVNPANISRIEVVNSIYVKGDQTYGGIVNFISLKRDFAGINLPSSGIFINYGFLTAGSYHFNSQLPGTPDTRNTVYWEPQLSLNEKNATNIKFTAPDTPGDYLIILGGISREGKLLRQQINFIVDKRK